MQKQSKISHIWSIITNRTWPHRTHVRLTIWIYCYFQYTYSVTKLWKFKSTLANAIAYRNDSGLSNVFWTAIFLLSSTSSSSCQVALSWSYDHKILIGSTVHTRSPPYPKSKLCLPITNLPELWKGKRAWWWKGLAKSTKWPCQRHSTSLGNSK